MNKRKPLLHVSLLFLLLAGCGTSNEAPVTTVTPTSVPAAIATSTPVPTATSTPTPTATPEPTATPVPDEPLFVDFANGKPANFEEANGWSNGNMFNVTWRKRNVTFKDGKMQLTIDNDKSPMNGIPYSGGEFRTKKFYGFGRYEVNMKAIKNDGVVSSFFTYTGPTDKNPWDEIDIEILGKDTTKVQFNYYTNGIGNHEYLYDLGFDASEDFHTYAFEWYPDKIVWFVDDVEVYTATVNIPVTKGKIMMNAWCGIGVDSWLKAFDNTNLPLTAEYHWIKFTPFE